MKSVGIVAEYNPFHNGHQYQIQHVRNTLNPDIVVAVMSGNFLQRGEPALVDKWTRAQMALAGGVDLVVELPAVFAVQPADYFAKGAIQTLAALGIDALSFGVETGTGSDFLKGAQWMVENESRINEAIQQRTDTDVPYAKQMEETLLELAPDFPLHLNSPNNQLGFAYAKEIVRNDLADTIQLAPIVREQAAYHERKLVDDRPIASATAIRLALLEGKEVASYIPPSSYPYLANVQKQAVSWEQYYPLLKYQLTVQSEESLRGIYQMAEGLENRLKSAASERSHFTGFMETIKTKRYTQTRLQRLLTYVLLQWKNEDVLTALEDIRAIRVLGFTEMGQAYLSEMKRNLTVPLIVNVNQTTKKLLPFDTHAGEVYRLGKDPLISRQDFGQKPIKVIDRSPID